MNRSRSSFQACRLLAIVVLVACNAFRSFSQVLFTQYPQPLQFFPRDATGQGTFRVEGVCDDPAYSHISAVIHNTTQKKLHDSVAVSLSEGHFVFRLAIPAILAEFSLDIYILNQSEARLIKHTEGLLSGDLFILNGQSNAVAPAADTVEVRKADSIDNRFLRTIGSSFGYMVHRNRAEDLRFLRPSPDFDFSLTRGHTGLLGLKLMDEISNQLGVPVCLVNGGNGSTTIGQHLAGNTPSRKHELQIEHDPVAGSPPRIYDRLFWKLSSHDLQTKVKAVFWYQGESDGAGETVQALAYRLRFDSLYSSWKQDYPNLERIFVVQINLGCGDLNHSLISDQQGRFEDRYPDVKVMSSVGSNRDERHADGCHYNLKGYFNLGSKLARLSLKELYDMPFEECEVKPAALVKAFYSGGELVLRFTCPVTVQQEASYPNKVVYMRDYFFDQNDRRILIQKVTEHQEEVRLLPYPHQDKVMRISYLPKMFTTIPSLYTGPWIMNRSAESIGVLSFYRREVLHEDADVLRFAVQDDMLRIWTYDASRFEKVTCYDTGGRLTWRSESSEYDLFVRNLSDLQAGIYCISVMKNGRLVNFRIIRY